MGFGRCALGTWSRGGRWQPDYVRDLLTRKEFGAEIRLFGLPEFLLARWRQLADQILTGATRFRHRALVRSMMPSVLNLIILTLVMASVIEAVAAGRTSSGVMIALLYTVQEYLRHVQNLSWRLERLAEFWNELGFVQIFLDADGEERPCGREAPDRLSHGVRFQDVTFRYPGSQRVALTGINLHIRPGERIALVGENGAGKSTLAKLLLGLYEPTSGRIEVDGTDLREIAPSSWRFGCN